MKSARTRRSRTRLTPAASVRSSSSSWPSLSMRVNPAQPPFALHGVTATPVAARRGSVRPMPLDRDRTAPRRPGRRRRRRVWAAQQPLDKRVFGVAYDDTELLGKSVTRGRGWPVVGIGDPPRQRRRFRRRSTRTSRRACRCPSGRAARGWRSPRTSRSGRSRRSPTACTPRATRCRSWPATARAFAPGDLAPPAVRRRRSARSSAA